MNKISFTKMHGAGNDFIMIDGIHQELPESLSAFCRDISHRHFSVGADQVLIIRKSQKQDYKMEIYNADGGEVEMCGNGIRCFAKFLRDELGEEKTKFKIETLAGVIKPEVILDHPRTTSDTLWVKVDMGEPGTRRSEDEKTRKHEKVLVGGVEGTLVSMGNPHCVVFVDDVMNFPVREIGPKIENDPLFPNRTNVEFVQVMGPGQIRQRTWERGAGETLACGTGASAAVVASVLNEHTERKVTVNLLGGDLDVVWDEKTNHVFKTGPATTVYQGSLIL